MQRAGSVTNLVVLVAEVSQVAEARRAASSLAQKTGMDETAAGKLAIVVTEAATNLVKHGGGGRILLSAHERSGASGVEVLAIDKGAGMADVRRCAGDGYST